MNNKKLITNEETIKSLLTIDVDINTLYRFTEVTLYTEALFFDVLSEAREPISLSTLNLLREELKVLFNQESENKRLIFLINIIDHLKFIIRKQEYLLNQSY